MTNATQVQTRAGKYPLQNGLVFFVVLSRANRLEKLQGIMVFRMRLYAVLFGQLVSKSKQGKCYSSFRCSDRRRASIFASVCKRVSASGEDAWTFGV